MSLQRIPPADSGLESRAPNPLVEAAVAPLLENAENQLGVTSILTETADPDHPRAAEVIARWKSVDGKKHPFLWKPVLFVAAVIAIVLAVALMHPEIRLVVETVDSSIIDEPYPPPPKGLTSEEKLLIRDPSLSWLQQNDSLRRSDPDNPAFYAEYAVAYISENSALPADYFETIARIAPRNSYFLYLPATIRYYDVIEMAKPIGPKPKPRIVDGVALSPLPVERDFIIKDQVAYEKSMELLGKAAELTKFDSYGNTLRVAQMRALRNDDNYVQRVNGLRRNIGGLSGIGPIIKIADLLSAQSQQLSRNGDSDGFLELVKIRQHIIRSMADSPHVTLRDEMVLAIIAGYTAEYFHYAAERLGLSELSEQFRKESDAYQAASERKRRRKKVPEELFIEEHGSVVASELLSFYPRLVDSPPPLTAGHLAPVRYAEHDLALRLGLAAAALVILIAALPVFLFRFIFPAPLRLTAARLVQLLRPGDWIFAIVLGVLLPIAAMLALSLFTGLGGRQWALNHFVLLFPGVHLVAILLLILLAPAVFIRWRLARRVAPLGVSCRPGIISIVAILGVIGLSVGAHPVVVKFGMGSMILKILAAAPAFWLATVLSNLFLAMIGKPAKRISLAATSMALLPAYAAAILALSATLPFLAASEKHWLAQDTLMNPDPDAPDFGLYEFRVAAQKRKEIREILGLGE